MATPSQRQVTQGPHSPPSGPEQQKCTRVTPKPRWSTNNNNRDNDNNSKHRNNSGSLHPRGNVDEQRHAQRPQLQRTLQFRSTVKLRTDLPPATSTATLNAIWTTATLPRNGARNSKHGARNRAANAIAQTSAQDELAVDFFKHNEKKRGLPMDADR